MRLLIVQLTDISCIFRDVVVFNTTFKKISIISSRSVVLVKEKPREPGENNQPPTTNLPQVHDKTTNLPQVYDKLYYIRLYRVYLASHDRVSNAQF